MGMPTEIERCGCGFTMNIILEEVDEENNENI